MQWGRSSLNLACRTKTYLLPRHRRPLKKTAFGWHSHAACQSDADQLPRQSLLFSLTTSLEQSADGSQTIGLIRQCNNDNRKSHKYVCITSNQPDTKI